MRSIAMCLVAWSVWGYSQAHAQQSDARRMTTPDNSIFAAMTYRLIGPFRGGRATGISGVAQQPNVYYFGSASGGLWKTTDAGITWKPLWDHFPEASPSIGDVVVAPSEPNVVYVGTGEANIRGDVVTGNGVYKSTDAGMTWQFIGLRDSESIGRMAVSPKDPDTLLVAALGHPFGENGERGIYRTRDGGRSWQRVLYVDDRTGGIDVQYDPGNPSIVYAALWQAYRKPWIFESGGAGSGLYRSTDGGTTWQRLTGHGLPGGILGRIGVAPTSDPKRVYALIEAKAGGLYRTDNGGTSWRLINGSDTYRQRAWYFTNVFADPKDPDRLFIMNSAAWESVDGGVTFKQVPTWHSDNHQLWINPHDTRFMINSNDGGADVSVDGGRTWTSELNQPTAQIYHISVDNQIPYHLYGAQQDSGTLEIPSAVVNGEIGEQSWHAVGGGQTGESGYVSPEPGDPGMVIASGYGGTLDRYNDRTGEIDPINPWARQVTGWAPKDLEHRSRWTVPAVFSPHRPYAIYYGSEVLFESDDLGNSWRILSPDLTRNEKSKQVASGGPISKDNTGAETYDTISSGVESPARAGLIWVGTDDGLIQLTTNGGKHWVNVTPKDMPAWGTVDMVEADPHKAGTAYIAVDCHGLDDFRPYAFRTEDFGKTWVPISEGIPDGSYVHAIRADPARAGLLYAATETGVFVSFDDGAHWQSLQLNLPRAPVDDIVVHDGDLDVATHGRSFWILDDLTPIRQWSDRIQQEAFHLFTPRPTVRILYSGMGDMTGSPAGHNPPAGVVVNYYLKNRPLRGIGKREGGGEAWSGDRVRIEFLDTGGHVIRTFPDPHQQIAAKKGNNEDFLSLPDGEQVGGGLPPQLTARPGLNRFAWNMRYDGAPSIPGTAMWAASLDGPLALPGRYEVRVTVDGRSETRPFDILPDPQLHVTAADLREQFNLGIAIREQLRQVQATILQIRELKTELATIEVSVTARKTPNGSQISHAAKALEREAMAVESELIQRRSVAHLDPVNFPMRLNNLVASLNALVAAGATAPTQSEVTEFKQLKAMASEGLQKWNRIKHKNLRAFNNLMTQSGFPVVDLQ